ncbi:MAG: hypothetical protein R8K46_08990 [Mariprofundaceae bacterium]
MYAADATLQTTGNLYTIDPATGASTVVGPLPVPITGLAVAPSGTLYGVSGGRTGNTLYVIDRATGNATPVGALGLTAPDITFIGATLYGWTRDVPDQLVTIDIATGVATRVGAAPSIVRRAIAADGAGVLYAADQTNGVGSLDTVDPATGVLTTGPTVTGGANGRLNGMVFVGATLYGVDSLRTSANLITINITTGASITIGALPNNIDALAWMDDTDGDADGMPDFWEAFFGVSDPALDGDGDGLTNLQEFNNNGDPNDADTDNDGLNDGDEVNIHGTSVLSTDSDADGVNDGGELAIDRDPLVVDSILVESVSPAGMGVGAFSGPSSQASRWMRPAAPISCLRVMMAWQPLSTPCCPPRVRR